MEDQRSPTPTTTHCNETTELGCEINNITSLTNSKSLALEANLTMQNISPLSTVRTTTTKISPKVPIASSYPVLKNTKKNSPPVDWLGKLPLIEGKRKPQSVKCSNNNKRVKSQNENSESTSYTHQKHVAPDDTDDYFFGLNWKKRSRLTRNLCHKQDWLNHLKLVRRMMKR